MDNWSKYILAFLAVAFLVWALVVWDMGTTANQKLTDVQLEVITKLTELKGEVARVQAAIDGHKSIPAHGDVLKMIGQNREILQELRQRQNGAPR